jgi:hypothetical protein
MGVAELVVSETNGAEVHSGGVVASVEIGVVEAGSRNGYNHSRKICTNVRHGVGVRVSATKAFDCEPRKRQCESSACAVPQIRTEGLRDFCTA